MKTIFIFNDSRLTDLEQRVSALGEDGQRFDTIVFDRATAPHCEYAMGSAHNLDASIDPSIGEPVSDTRKRMLASYDRVYGPGNWMPIWLESPAQNIAWCRAMCLYRSRVADRAPTFGDGALARLMRDIFGAPAPVAHHTVH